MNADSLQPMPQKTKRIAVIDLGTNTFNLLIADVASTSFRLVYNEKEGVALGMGGITQGVIVEEAFERGVKAVQKFRQICNAHDVEEIRAFGTSALRDARNTPFFMQEIYSKTGIEIQLISGEDEAELIYKGVKWSYDFQEPAIIMDIGGGSTEFIVANASGIETKISLNIGVSRIIQELTLSDPLTQADILAIEDWLETRSMSFFEYKQIDILIGASGSFETFHEMIHDAAFPFGIQSQEIDLTALKAILDWIIASDQQARDEHPFIIPIRRKMAPVAAVKTRWVMHKLQIKRVFVSPCSLKEGGLYEGK